MWSLRHSLSLLLAFFLLAGLGMGLNASAQNSEQDLQELTKAEKEARAEAANLEKKREEVSSEISTLQNSLKTIAGETRIFERDARILSEKKRKIEININRISATIASDEEDLGKLLAALQRLEANPPPALAMRPDDAVTAAHTAQLMASLTQQLDARTRKLKIQLTAFAQEQKAAADTQAQIDANTKQLETRRLKTLTLVETKTDLKNSIDRQRKETQATIEQLAKEAATLKELLEKLKAESTRVARIMPRIKPGKGKPSSKPRRSVNPPLALPESIGPFAKARGRLNLPVEGKLVKRYGSGEKGLTFSAQSQGQVLSPYAGRVEFAGPFKNYDQVVILAVGDGYYLLMTGLGKIYAETGEVVGQGDPIGIMPYSRSGEDNLYLELRKDGKTLDPSPWLAL